MNNFHRCRRIKVLSMFKHEHHSMHGSIYTWRYFSDGMSKGSNSYWEHNQQHWSSGMQEIKANQWVMLSLHKAINDWWLILVGGKVRVTRQCGYILEKDPVADDQSCHKDGFTSFTSSFYCSCSENQCNSSNVGAAQKVLLYAMFLLTVFSFDWFVISSYFEWTLKWME